MKRFTFGLLALLAILGFTNLAAAQAAAVASEFQCLGAHTFAAGLNDAGQVVGWYGDPSFTDSKSFVRKKNGGCEELPMVEGSTSTIALGINDPGVIVGIYFPGKEGYGSAFLYEKGAYFTFDYPGAQVCQTFAMGINNRGQIVGLYDLWKTEDGRQVCDGPDIPFLREPDGTFVTLAAPEGATDSAQVNGINPQGMMVGNYLAGDGEYGFLRHSNGATVAFHPAGAKDTMPTGINAQGEVVGRFFTEIWDAPIGPCHSFFRDTGGSIVEIKYPDPGALHTCVGGINAPGEVSGAWFDGSTWRAFVRDLKALLPVSP